MPLLYRIKAFRLDLVEMQPLRRPTLHLTPSDEESHPSTCVILSEAKNHSPKRHVQDKPPPPTQV
jgi:hypothetical protein